jgi:hypothetical protein
MAAPYDNLKDRLYQATSHMPLSVAEATVSVLESFYTAKDRASAKSQAASIVLTRAMKALVDAIKTTHELKNIAAASSDLEVILALLSSPEVSIKLKEANPLAPAKLRGLKEMEKLVHAEGGSVSGEEAAKLLGLKRQSIDKARKNGRLLGLPRGQKKFLYPIWQFEKGHILPGLKEVYAHLPPMGPWMQAAFMLSPNACIGEKSPLKALRHKDINAAIKAAQSCGEHGAD